MKSGEKEYVVLQISKWIFNSISRVFKEEKKNEKRGFPSKYRESDVFGANRDYAVRDYASNGLFGRRLNECHAS